MTVGALGVRSAFRQASAAVTRPESTTLLLQTCLCRFIL